MSSSSKCGAIELNVVVVVVVVENYNFGANRSGEKSGGSRGWMNNKKTKNNSVTINEKVK